MTVFHRNYAIQFEFLIELFGFLWKPASKTRIDIWKDLMRILMSWRDLWADMHPKAYQTRRRFHAEQKILRSLLETVRRCRNPLNEFRKMLGGLGEVQARRLLQNKTVKSFKIRGEYHIPKQCVIDYVLSTHYAKYRQILKAQIP